MTPDWLIMLGSFGTVGAIFALGWFIACELHTAEGRAVWRHERQIGKATARYIALGLMPADAKVLARADAERSSRELLDALRSVDANPSPAPKIRAIR